MKENYYIYNQKLIHESEQTTFLDFDSFKVMQQAAFACYKYIKKNLSFKKALILCGPGNNGGDSVLIAENLRKNNLSVNIHFPLGKPKTNDAKNALNLLSTKKIIIDKLSFNNYDLIIDGLFGTGLNRKLNNKTLSLFKKINKTNIKVISIDMPSGVFTNSGYINGLAIKANLTLSLHRYKAGQWLLPGKEYCGKIVLLDIGLVNIDYKCFLKLNTPIKLPAPSLVEHKFSRGSCLIVVGEKLIGASKLAYFACSQSALRSGAGICKFLVHEKNSESFRSHFLEEVVLDYKNNQHLFSIISEQKPNALIYGCGIENNKQNMLQLKFIISQSIDLVLDATVFSLFKKNKKILFELLNKRSNQTIMTPHTGEFKRIFKTTNNKVNDTLNAANVTKSTIVFKGHDTVIGSSDGSAYINAVSSTYLATAGSGDVLAGLIGGLLSQGLDAINASRLGCYIHSQCAINLGPGLIASDLIKEIPTVMKKLIY